MNRNCTAFLAAAVLLASPHYATAGFGRTYSTTWTSSTESQCKVEGAELGRVGLVLHFENSTVTFTTWTPKMGSPGEYVGFSFTVAGDPVDFWVKAGTEFFYGGFTTSWQNPYGTGGRLAKGISHLDFCLNPPPTVTSTTTTTTLLPVTTTTIPVVTTTILPPTTLDTVTTTTLVLPPTTEPVTTTTLDAVTTTTVPATTTTTLPPCEVVEILEDPTEVRWGTTPGTDRFFTHGRLIPKTPVTYPIERLSVELETVGAADPILHQASCELVQKYAWKWKCKAAHSKGLVKVKTFKRTGEPSYVYRFREWGASIAVPHTMIVKINVRFLCEMGTHTGVWSGVPGDRIWIRF